MDRPKLCPQMVGYKTYLAIIAAAVSGILYVFPLDLTFSGLSNVFVVKLPVSSPESILEIEISIFFGFGFSHEIDRHQH